jgi:hypothetical protein
MPLPPGKGIIIIIIIIIIMKRGWAIKSSPCTATFSDLLCFGGDNWE